MLFEVSVADVRSVRRTIGGTRMAELPATRHPWSDAWLLLAVGCQLNLEEISFPELITRADGIQHAVPSFDELDGAWRA